ncbi:MAG TPA: hypothetical protein VH092_04760 [Urbifossiella sp.]|jgi:hypothetical protein|nr:hypothetical protein [Urbifossiella sp.]
MALISIGENKWRMLRRVIKKKKFRYEDARGMTRHDQTQFDWLIENGFISPVGDGNYEMTDKGRASAELGEYDWQPPPPGVTPPTPAKKAARLKQKA